MGTYIKNIKIRNFRVFEDVEFNLFEDETILIGKNNIGKTTFYKTIEVLERKKLCFEDINANYLKMMFNSLTNNVNYADLETTFIGYEAIVCYDEDSNHIQFRELLSNCDLTGEFKVYVHYELSEILYNQLRSELDSCQNEAQKIHLFKEKFVDTLTNASTVKILKDILYFGIVSATRTVDTEKNKNSSKQTLDVFSHLGSAIRENHEIKNSNIQNIDKVNEALKEDEKVKEFIAELRNFTFPSEVSEKYMLRHNEYDPYNNIRPMLVHQHNELLYLPDHYNGLGYTNFYKIFIEIAKIIDEVNERRLKEFILIVEEPEAFTHPQMQYAFIRNIYGYIKSKMLSNDSSVQLVIISHSAHIVSQAEPSKVLLLTDTNDGIQAKRIIDDALNEQDQKFMKQYLTVINSEILFSDKVICVEGDTELMLIKKFMHMVDSLTADDDKVPLLSQNISVISVGTYFNKFKKFIDLINVEKLLLITDIDYVSISKEKCAYSDAIKSSNDNINKLLLENADFSVNDIKDLAVYQNKDNNVKYYNKYMTKNYIEVTSDILGAYICVAHQNKLEVKENETSVSSKDYFPRSFEDAFIASNYIEFDENIKIKNRSDILNYSDLEKLWLVKPKEKKSDFAFEILILDDSEINIPSYIEEGLKWIK